MALLLLKSIIIIIIIIIIISMVIQSEVHLSSQAIVVITGNQVQKCMRSKYELKQLLCFGGHKEVL